MLVSKVVFAKNKKKKEKGIWEDVKYWEKNNKNNTKQKATNVYDEKRKIYKQVVYKVGYTERKVHKIEASEKTIRK